MKGRETMITLPTTAQVNQSITDAYNFVKENPTKVATYVATAVVLGAGSYATYTYAGEIQDAAQSCFNKMSETANSYSSAVNDAIFSNLKVAKETSAPKNSADVTTG